MVNHKWERLLFTDSHTHTNQKLYIYNYISHDTTYTHIYKLSIHRKLQ